MRLLFFAMVRLLVLATILITALAVVIGRSHREPPGPGGAPAGGRGGARHQAVNDDLDRDSIRVLDVETGTVERIAIPRSDTLRYAACSPWRDGSGRTQVVAQWRGRDEQDAWGAGLARCELPGGAVLDRVAMDVVPRGSPCWFPDGSARVLFAGGDGRLYQFAFEDRAGGSLAASPLPLTWRPGVSPVELFISDPTWPSHPQFADTVLATVFELRPGEPRSPSDGQRSHLWWLRLDPGRTQVVAAGRLIEPDPRGRRGEDVAGESLGVVSVTPGGDGLALAYLARRPQTFEIRLRLVPLAIDPATGTPRAGDADAADLAGGRAFSAPAFSKDRLWLYSFPRESATPGRAERSSVADALADRPCRANSSAALVAAVNESGLLSLASTQQ